METAIQQSPLDLIRLIAPTTRPDRLAAAVAGAQGFVYLVARLGVTGATAALADGLAESIARVRGATPLPVAVGFGISTPAQARTLAGQADGVVVGSALVEILGTRGVDAAGSSASAPAGPRRRMAPAEGSRAGRGRPLRQVLAVGAGCSPWWLSYRHPLGHASVATLI